jgi:hypothetical protein
MAKSSSASKAGGCQCADAQNLRDRGALRYAVPAPRKPWVSIHGHPSDRVAAGAGIVEDYPQDWPLPVDFLGSGRYFGVTAA